jgi:hypothetical protein
MEMVWAVGGEDSSSKLQVTSERLERRGRRLVKAEVMREGKADLILRSSFDVMSATALRHSSSWILSAEL